MSVKSNDVHALCSSQSTSVTAEPQTRAPRSAGHAGTLHLRAHVHVHMRGRCRRGGGGVHLKGSKEAALVVIHAATPELAFVDDRLEGVRIPQLQWIHCTSDQPLWTRSV